MNERILELWAQSFVRDNYVNMGPDGPALGFKFDPEKFAELMVAEFVKVSNETADAFESTQPDVAYGIRRNINSVIHHFGVEG